WESREVSGDGVQRMLVGPAKIEAEWGTGLIPRADLVDWARRAGVPDALDGVVVKHVSGGRSTLGFKSYDQGRTKWQAETLDFVWFDEEPPMDLYTEGLTRTNATQGIVWLTFTPLLGMSEVVYSFDEACGPLESVGQSTCRLLCTRCQRATPNQLPRRPAARPAPRAGRQQVENFLHLPRRAVATATRCRKCCACRVCGCGVFALLPIPKTVIIGTVDRAELGEMAM